MLLVTCTGLQHGAGVLSRSTKSPKLVFHKSGHHACCTVGEHDSEEGLHTADTLHNQDMLLENLSNVHMRVCNKDLCGGSDESTETAEGAARSVTIGDSYCYMITSVARRSETYLQAGRSSTYIAYLLCDAGKGL